MGNEFERLAAKFVGVAVSAAPKDLASLIFSSSVSARSPDASNMWHSGYRLRHPFKLFLQLLVASAAGIAKGLIRTLRPPKIGYGLYGTIKDSILIVTSECGYASGDGYKTKYVDTDDGDAILVVGPIQQCGSKAKRFMPIPAIASLRVTLALTICGICAFFKSGGSIVGRIFILLEWFSWTWSLQWVRNYYLERILVELIGSHGIRKIGCIHEMHSYARVVWRIARARGIKTYTVQHASLSKDKLWYFAYPEETSRGLVLPDYFYASEERVIRLLNPYFPDTIFMKGCSCRYSQWKLLSREPAEKEGSYYLFVSGLARFDNEAVIGSLRELLKNGKISLPLRLRMHSHADTGRRLRRWIDRSKETGAFEVSSGSSLSSDLSGAIAVIGMSTTVLEEALLVGRPVIQLRHPEYLSYVDLEGVHGVKRVAYDELTEGLLRSFNESVERGEIRERFGLAHPTVDYKTLFH